MNLPPRHIRLVYAPVISPRVAEIARRHDVSYIDYVGNCRIVNPAAGLFISRADIPNPSTDRKRETTADPFAPKSSRIVRAMLHQPNRGWQVNELARYSNVSAGLASRVKRTLVNEGFAFERQRLLHLCDPAGLLENWSKNYPGPAEKISLYFRGGTREAESSLDKWCRQNGMKGALGGFAAAWQLAAEVRYNVANFYVEERGFEPKTFEMLTEIFGAKVVESGANGQLWRGYDESIFVNSKLSIGSERPDILATSALQTYLDLKHLGGRGEDAANAIFEKHLGSGFQAAIERQRELQDGTV
jgi:hypothetical protein